MYVCGGEVCPGKELGCKVQNSLLLWSTVMLSGLSWWLRRYEAVQSLGQENPLEKRMASHSSILAWRIPLTEEPGGLQSSSV